MALDRTCKPPGNSFTMIQNFKLLLRSSLTKVYSFDSNVGYLESHNDLDMEIKLMLTRNQIFSGVYYVPTSSSTWRVKSYKQGTCKA